MLKLYKKQIALTNPYYQGTTTHILLDSNIIVRKYTEKLPLKHSIRISIDCKCYFYFTSCIYKEILYLIKNKVLLKQFLKVNRIRLINCYHKFVYGDKCIKNTVFLNPFLRVATFDQNLLKNLKSKLNK
ncbi:NBP1 putative nucleotide binding protein (nucleomorph) [Bigelowiella natans]|uniref:NBP1 putative nucleotide binding protein n=1 Tax=Bigelowiella natans TaxID=227086 RepID=Q3LWG9_BIGNA|nr:NBP1 putative nucleotide binding protein [Bigelowiella natans]ABA27243.1 NBP1 putative nucleotide binding protein [Bigelowiella natans]